MTHNLFQAPGFDDLAPNPGRKSPSPDGTQLRSMRQRTGSARPRSQPKPDSDPNQGSTEPIKEPEPKPDPLVKLSNGKWLEPQGKYGQPIQASVDVEIPSELSAITRVVFIVYELLPDGKRAERTPRYENVHAKDGKAICSITVAEPEVKAGQVPEKAYFQFVAKHAHAKEHQGPRLEFVPGGPASPFESVVYYSPLRKEYLVFNSDEEYKSILPEFEKMLLLRGMSLKAFNATDFAARKNITEKIATLVHDLWDGAEIIGESEPVVEELVLVRGPKKWASPPGWAYIRPDPKKNGVKHKGKWHKDSDEAIKKNLEDLFKKAPGSKEHSPFFSGDLTLKLFKTDPIQAGKVYWQTGEKKEGKVAGQAFTFSKEASVSRLMMDWDGAEGTIDLKERRIRIGTGGKVSYGALDGKMECEFPCPEKGVNLLTLLKMSSPYLQAILAKDRKCLLRLNVAMKAEAFAGLTISGALNLLELDLSKEKLPNGKRRGRQAETGVEGKGFLGAKLEAGLTVGVEWTSPERGKFEALGSCGAEAAGSAGVGAEAEWKIEYREGVFHFHGGAGLTIALGLKGKFSFELGLAEGCQFIGYLFYCADFHFVMEIEKVAFQAYKNYTFTLMTLGEAAFTAQKALVTEVITHFGNWFENLGNKFDDVKKSLLASSSHSSALLNVPPEALGQALITIMRTRESGDFRSILSILYSTVRRNANTKTDPYAIHKLRWTLRFASGILDLDMDMSITEAEKETALKAGIKKLMDFGYGRGYVDKKGNPQDPNDDFIRELRDLLMKYEVR